MLEFLKRRHARVEADRRDRCVEEHSVMCAISKHWSDTDMMLRQVEAKDSIFELEQLRRTILEDFGKKVMEPIRNSFPVKCNGELSKRNYKLYKKERRKMCEPVKDFDDFGYLKRIYYAAVTMDAYKRQNRNMRRELQLQHRQGFRAEQSLKARVDELEKNIERARRKSWCISQNRVWEPTQFIHFEAKALAKQPESNEDKNGQDQQETGDVKTKGTASPGPRSFFLDLRDEGPGSISDVGGLVRLVDRLECPAIDFIVKKGGHYSDETSVVF